MSQRTFIGTKPLSVREYPVRVFFGFPPAIAPPEPAAPAPVAPPTPEEFDIVQVSQVTVDEFAEKQTDAAPVELPQPGEVSKNLEEIDKIIAAAEAEGEYPPSPAEDLGLAASDIAANDAE